MERKHTESRAFSLLELIVVITIMSLLATFIAPTFVRINHEAKLTRSLTDVNTLGNTAVQKYHELSASGGQTPIFANVGTPVEINTTTVLFQAGGYFGATVWGDLFSGRKIPVSPIDNQPYYMNVISNGSVKYTPVVGGNTYTESTDPEFQVYWVSSDAANPDTISAFFKP